MKGKLSDLNKNLEEIKNPELKEKQGELNVLQEKLEKIEKQRREFYILKSDIATLKNNRRQKNDYIIQLAKETELTLSASLYLACLEKRKNLP